MEVEKSERLHRELHDEMSALIRRHAGQPSHEFYLATLKLVAKYFPKFFEEPQYIEWEKPTVCDWAASRFHPTITSHNWTVNVDWLWSALDSDDGCMRMMWFAATNTIVIQDDDTKELLWACMLPAGHPLEPILRRMEELYHALPPDATHFPTIVLDDESDGTDV